MTRVLTDAEVATLARYLDASRTGSDDDPFMTLERGQDGLWEAVADHPREAWTEVGIGERPEDALADLAARLTARLR